MIRMSRWRDQFSLREQKEIELCMEYERRFAHGTTGHNAMMILAKQARILDEMEAQGVNIPQVPSVTEAGARE